MSWQNDLSVKRKLSFVALTGLVLLLGLELLVRVVAAVTMNGRVVTYDTVLGWKLIPFSRKLYKGERKPYLIEVNSKGLRDREHSYEKPAGTVRVVVLGDSMVFGAGGVNRSDLFTTIIEHAREGLEVINMGVPAFSIDQEYLYLKLEGLKYGPDLVVMCVFVNDFAESAVAFNESIGRPKGYFSERERELVFHPPSIPYYHRWAQDSLLLGLVDHSVGSRVRTYSNVRREINREDTAHVFRKVVVAARNLARDSGAEFVAVYIPFERQGETNVIQHVLGELVAREGLVFLDLMELMSRASSNGSLYFDKDIHLNERGHQVVAEALYSFMEANTSLGAKTRRN